MKSETLKSLIYENIKHGATTIYVKYMGLDNFIDIPVDCFIAISFDCIVYITETKTKIEQEYIPVDKIVHISFEKRIGVKELID